MTAIAALILTLAVDPPGPTMIVFPPFGHCMGIYRAGTEQLAVLLGGLVRFSDPQGLACVKLDEWNSPGQGDDDELAVYGVNSGTGQIIYNASMYTLGLYGSEGSADDELMSPHGIAADKEGRVIVADTGNSRVVVLRRDGARLRPAGTIEGGLEEPWGVALGSDGRIWVTDRGRGLLLCYENPGDAVPSTLALDSPRGVAAYGGGRWDFYREDEFQAVVTGDGSSLAVVRGGEVSATVTTESCGGSFFNYPVIDYFGNVLVSDSIACRIHKFDRNLNYICSFGEPGTGDTQLDAPTGLAIWRRYGQVFVAEKEGARYFWVGSDFTGVEFEPSGHGFSFSATLSEPSNVTASVLDPEGGTAHAFDGWRSEDRTVSLEWDGILDSGSPAPPGLYRLRVVIEPTYSSRGYFEKTWEESFDIGQGGPESN